MHVVGSQGKTFINGLPPRSVEHSTDHVLSWLQNTSPTLDRGDQQDDTDIYNDGFSPGHHIARDHKARDHLARDHKARDHIARDHIAGDNIARDQPSYATSSLAVLPRYNHVTVTPTLPSTSYNTVYQDIPCTTSTQSFDISRPLFSVGDFGLSTSKSVSADNAIVVAEPPLSVTGIHTPPPVTSRHRLCYADFLRHSNPNPEPSTAESTENKTFSRFKRGGLILKSGRVSKELLKSQKQVLGKKSELNLSYIRQAREQLKLLKDKKGSSSGSSTLCNEEISERTLALKASHFPHKLQKRSQALKRQLKNPAKHQEIVQEDILLPVNTFKEPVYQTDSDLWQDLTPTLILDQCGTLSGSASTRNCSDITGETESTDTNTCTFLDESNSQNRQDIKGLFQKLSHLQVVKKLQQCLKDRATKSSTDNGTMAGNDSRRTFVYGSLGRIERPSSLDNDDQKASAGMSIALSLRQSPKEVKNDVFFGSEEENADSPAEVSQRLPFARHTSAISNTRLFLHANEKPQDAEGSWQQQQQSSDTSESSPAPGYTREQAARIVQSAQSWATARIKDGSDGQYSEKSESEGSGEDTVIRKRPASSASPPPCTLPPFKKLCRQQTLPFLAQQPPPPQHPAVYTRPSLPSVPPLPAARPSTPLLLQQQPPQHGPDRQQRYQSTRTALEQSGLLDLTTRLGTVIRTMRQYEQDVLDLRRDSHTFLISVLNHPANTRFKEYLLHQMLSNFKVKKRPAEEDDT